jgi:hypothetical protein
VEIWRLGSTFRNDLIRCIAGSGGIGSFEVCEEDEGGEVLRLGI